MSNSERSDEEDEEPPEAELGLEVEDEVPPADDEDGEDVLPCDMDGEEEEPELLLLSPAA